MPINTITMPTKEMKSEVPSQMSLRDNRESMTIEDRAQAVARPKMELQEILVAVKTSIPQVAMLPSQEPMELRK